MENGYRDRRGRTLVEIYRFSFCFNRLKCVQNKDFQKELIPIADEDLFVVLNHPNANFDYPVHYHPEYEINLVMYTHGERVIGGEKKAAADFGIKGTSSEITVYKGEEIDFNLIDTVGFEPQKAFWECLFWTNGYLLQSSNYW